MRSSEVLIRDVTSWSINDGGSRKFFYLSSSLYYLRSSLPFQTLAIPHSPWMC